MSANPHSSEAGPSDPGVVSTGGGSDVAIAAAVLQAVGEAVLAVDTAGRIHTWNDAAAALFGASAEEVLGFRLLGLVPRGELRDQVARILEHVRGGESWCGELLVPGRGGCIFPVLVTASPLRDAGDRIVGGACVARDASDRHAAEEVLRQTEQRMDLVRRVADSVIWEMDFRTGALRWSDAITTAFGYPPEAVEPTWEWWQERIHPEDRARVTERLRAVLENSARFWTEEYRFRRHDGGYALVFDRAHVARDDTGAPVRAVGTLVDLTERRRLREQQRFLSQASMILDLSLDYETTLPTIARLATTTLAQVALIRVDPGAGFPGFTAAAHADPRFQPVVDEVKDLLDAGVVRDSILDRVQRSGEPVLLAHLPPDLAGRLGSESRIGKLALEIAPQSAMAVPLRARQQQIGVMAVGRTTEVEPYDEHDLHVIEELGRRIGLAVDHARLFQAAQIANRAKSDFLAVISHELRTPLTAVLGYADLLSAQVSGPLNARQKHQVDRIRAASDRLLQLMESVLAFARLETGSDRARFERIAVRPLLDRLADVLGPRAREEGGELEIDTEHAPEVMVTDAEKVRQILVALLLNAMKFTRQGKIGLRVDRANGRITFDVSDSGPGIAPEHLPYIFNPFWQAEQPATRRTGGAGLGLSVARRMAHLLGGDVTVVNSSGSGAVFRLELPEYIEQ